MQGWYKANIKRGQRDMRQVMQMTGAPRRLSIAAINAAVLLFGNLSSETPPSYWRRKWPKTDLCRLGVLPVGAYVGRSLLLPARHTKE